MITKANPMITNEGASKAGGTRNFGKHFTVSWDSPGHNKLNVHVYGGGAHLKSLSLSSEDPSASSTGNNGTFYFTGNFTANYNADGLHGNLRASELVFTGPSGVEPKFDGEVGPW